MKKLFINPVPCTGCLNCETACAQKRAGDQDRRASAIRVLLDIFGGRNSHVACAQCEEAACAKGCPAGAIRRNPDTGAWVIDRLGCLRCGSCVRICPFSAMNWWDEARGPVKCDLCGGSPACVASCLFGAIRFLEPGDPGCAARGMPEAEQDAGLGRGMVST
jgi:carbon-monoxide dehydrogenase iron sulfur subunit